MVMIAAIVVTVLVMVVAMVAASMMFVVMVVDPSEWVSAISGCVKILVSPVVALESVILII